MMKVRKDKASGGEVSSLGKRIKQYRDRRGMTQYRLSIDAGLPQATLSRLERGLLKGLNSDTLKRVANALDTSIDVLMGDGKTPDREVYKRQINDNILSAVVKNSKSRMLFVDRNDMICFSNIDGNLVGRPVHTFLPVDEWSSIKNFIVDQVEVRDEVSPFRTDITVDGKQVKASILPIADVGRGGARTVPIMMIRFADPIEELEDQRGAYMDKIDYLNITIGSIARLSKQLIKPSLSGADMEEMVYRELGEMTGCDEMIVIHKTKTKVVVDQMVSLRDSIPVKSPTFMGESRKEILSKLSRLLGFIEESGAYSLDKSVILFPVNIPLGGLVILGFNFLNINISGMLLDRLRIVSASLPVAVSLLRSST
jgi:transcriptional regulator with XRE-family HTH domain